MVFATEGGSSTVGRAHDRLVWIEPHELVYLGRDHQTFLGGLLVFSLLRERN